MAYEVTASRRRPQRFEDLIGQDFVSATLQKSIASGRIAHAYLFSGPRGCGKTTSARILAKALNCEHGPAPTPCGECVHCREIARGSSLDVIEIDGASNTGVNDVRQIKDEVLFPPNSCRYKVYIIDEVHMLSMSAFNALLKTIEEPPPYVVFIFATTELHKVPATIKSRCQQFNFRLVPAELLKNALAAAAGENGIQADSEALYWIARQGNGSVRDSYTLFDQVAAFSDGHITFDKIKDKLGLTGFDQMNRLAEACAGKDPGQALSILDEILESGVSVEQCITDCAEYFRNLLFLQTGITKESLLGQNPSRFPKTVRQAWGRHEAEKGLETMLRLFRDIRYSLDSRCELELAVAKLCWLANSVSPEELYQAFAAARDILAAGGTAGIPAAGIPESFREKSPAKAEGSAQPAWQTADAPASAFPETPGNAGTDRTAADPGNSAPVPPAELPKALAEYFRNSKTMLSAVFSQTSRWEKHGGEISFSVSKPLQFQQMETEKACIQEAIRVLSGEDLHLSIRLEKAAEEESQSAIPPQVEAVCNVFRGTVLPRQKQAPRREAQQTGTEDSGENRE